jgi:hypothetical protein
MLGRRWETKEPWDRATGSDSEAGATGGCQSQSLSLSLSLPVCEQGWPRTQSAIGFVIGIFYQEEARPSL